MAVTLSLPFDTVPNTLQSHLVDLISSGMKNNIGSCQKCVDLEEGSVANKNTVEVLEVAQDHL